LHPLAEATTKHSHSTKTLCDTKQAMGVIGTFVLTPTVAMLLGECLPVLLERIIGEDI